MQTIEQESGVFDWTSIAPREKDFALAITAYDAGDGFPEIVDLLRDEGLSEDFVTDVVKSVAQDRAFGLFLRGKSEAEVVDALLVRGLTPHSAQFVAKSALRKHERIALKLGGGKWQMRSLAVGGILLATGMILKWILGWSELEIVYGPSQALMLCGVICAAYGGLQLRLRAM